jgi:hypothetical protein
LFTLGGTEGFPGLRTGERRGDRLAYATVGLLQRIAGPLYARAEVGGGQTSNTRARNFEMLAGIAGGWVNGAELGLAADLPLGVVSVGYGFANTGRPVFKVRMGS